jgi:hypothetical protein
MGIGLRDRAEAHTNVGDIRLQYASDAPPAVHVNATTGVGEIDFTGPTEISARLAAGTNVGSIDTNRPLTVRGTVGKSLHSTLGDGEGRIELHTNVGAIHIR